MVYISLLNHIKFIRNEFIDEFTNESNDEKYKCNTCKNEFDSPLKLKKHIETFNIFN